MSFNFNPLNTQRGGTHADHYTILPINVPVGLRSFVFSHQGNAIDDSLVVKSLEHGDPPLCMPVALFHAHLQDAALFETPRCGMFLRRGFCTASSTGGATMRLWL